MSNFSDMDNVFIMDHPLIQHKISILRNKETGTNEFRKLIEEIAVLMGKRVNFSLFIGSDLRCKHHIFFQFLHRIVFVDITGFHSHSEFL